MEQANFAGHHDPSRHLDGAQSDPTHPTSPAITYTSRKKNRPRRATTPTWKVKEAGSWNALLARAGQSSHKVRKKKYTQRVGQLELINNGTPQDKKMEHMSEAHFLSTFAMVKIKSFASQEFRMLKMGSIQEQSEEWFHPT
ncbi:hypothetical protein B0T10DRAFT_463321 [Thelonectria olida]|uniref:Uncharacterized protein n=1 Tax=Thelonectria olida TaxID=1576542 RepID=A0A9P8W0A0_9HYPO|nr:hypothetical protein B0T10DRAFT_463321 [Thelonectria olida]